MPKINAFIAHHYSETNQSSAGAVVVRTLVSDKIHMKVGKGIYQVDELLVFSAHLGMNCASVYV